MYDHPGVSPAIEHGVLDLVEDHEGLVQRIRKGQ